jgi:hypothetical protein
LKTDEDIEIEENAIEDILEKKESIDTEALEYEDVNPELARELEWINKESKLVTTHAFAEQESQQLDIIRKMILTKDSRARASYANQHGLSEDMLIDPEFNGNNALVQLPSTLFDTDYDDEREEYSVLQGNLSEWWNKV